MKTLQKAVLAIGLVGAARLAAAQFAPPPDIPAVSSRSPYSRNRSDDTPISPALTEQIEKGRQSDRQRRLIAETNRLLALANQLRAEMDKPSKDTTSPEVIKKTEEIERLARSVRERMKG